MPQSTRHVLLCKALYEMLAAVLAPEHTVGFDNFVYFDASDPGRKLAPDAFVKLGVPWHDFESYLAWEEGTPEVAFEVLSPSDTPERWTFQEKLRRYLALGVLELVAIDIDAQPGARLRVWDRIEHDLVERVVENDTTECVTLGLTLLVGAVEHYPVALRIARDKEGKDLVPTDLEARRTAQAAQAQAEAAQAQAEAAQARSEAARNESEAARDASDAARKAAEARVAELERLLAERKRS